MNKKFKILLSFLIVLSLFASTFITAFATTSGSLNSEISWVLTDDGVLTISGNGVMPEYSLDNPSPFFCSTDIKSVVISSGVKNVADCLFVNCSNIKTISVSESVSSVGTFSFFGCTSLKSINVNKNNNSFTSVSGVLFNKDETTLVRFPAAKISSQYVFKYGVKNIAEAAFANCVNLDSVIISNSVTKLGHAAFVGAESLKSIVLSESLLYISEECFLGCKNLQSVSFPDSVTYIDVCAFAECGSLSSVNFGDGLVSIGECAFLNCSNIEAINIPDSVKTIGEDAFAECGSLSTVNFGDGLVSIGECAFFDCSNIEAINIPDSVKTIGEDAFADCANLSYIELPDGIESFDFTVFKNTAYYNDSDNWEDDVLYIGNHLVKAKSTLSGVYVIKDGTKSVANKAFNQCSYITSIDIHDGLETIGSSAFYNCKNLIYITMPDSLKLIGASAFYGCESLKGVLIPDNIKTIESNTFSNCKSLSSVEFGNGVTTIAQHAFYNCDNIVSVRIPDGVNSIGAYAFNSCEKLTSVALPQSVSVIGDVAFYDCQNLKFVFFGGTQADWSNISIGDNNIPLTNAFVHYECFDHTFKIIEFVEPTYTDGGYTISECIVCAYSHYQYIPQLDVPGTSHVFSTRWFIDVVPTETIPGEKSHHCLHCDERRDVTPIYYNPVVTDCVFVDTDGFICNGEITYVVSVKGGVGVSGSVFAAVFDPALLEPVEDKCGAYTVVDADGNKIPNYSGFYTSGLKYGTNDVFVIANTNYPQIVRNKDTEYLKFTFKVKDVDVTDVAVDFYCLEFNGTQQIANNDFEVLVSHSVNDVVIGSHTSPTEWIYDTVNLTKTGVCPVCGDYCNETIAITDVLTFELNEEKSGYVVTDCISDYRDNLIIPEIYNNLPVIEIGNNAFDDCSYLKGVKIPDSVLRIGENAFPDNDVIIFCQKNDVAYTYAVSNNINWIADTDNVKFILHKNIIYTDILSADFINEISCSDGIAFETDASYACTGNSIKITLNGVKHSEYALVAEGDTNGDSVCDVLDCFDVERAADGHLSLSGCYLEAGDFNSDGLIDVLDYQCIVNKSVL